MKPVLLIFLLIIAGCQSGPLEGGWHRKPSVESPKFLGVDILPRGRGIGMLEEQQMFHGDTVQDFVDVPENPFWVVSFSFKF